MIHKWLALDWCSKISQTSTSTRLYQCWVTSQIEDRVPFTHWAVLCHTDPKDHHLSQNFTSLLWKLSFILCKKLPTKILLDHQFSLVAQSCPTLCDPMNYSTPGLPVHHQLPEFTQTHVHRVGDGIQPSHPLSSPTPAPNPSEHRGLFRWVNSSHEVAKVCGQRPKSFQWTTRTIDWLNLFAVQGTLKSLLQHHSSKAPILRCSAFFTVQLSHPYMTTGKTIALTRWTFVEKVMTLLLNMLSRLVITFLSRNKHLLISWLKSPSAVILEPKKIVWHCFHCFPIYLPWSDGTRCHDLSFLTVELEANFFIPLSLSSRGFLVPLHFLP